jgi:4'-phosphopantetheinyl transferase
MNALSPIFATPHVAPLRAARERVDVRSVTLDLAGHEAGEALRVLSAEERAHAARLRVGAGRWVAARAALRRVLGRCLDLAPERVSFAPGANGKPRLASPAGVDLRFSLSHSGAMGLIAVRVGHDIGVDLEQLRDDVDGEAIAREIFNAAERGAMSAPAIDARRAFFRAWVRREALAKATERGIAAPASEAEAARFTVRDLDAPAGFAAAVASEGSEWIVERARAIDTV